MKEALAELKDYDDRTDAAILAIQRWQPGDRLADVTRAAVLTIQNLKIDKAMAG